MGRPPSPSGLDALEEQLRNAILDAAELLVVVLDREGRIQRFNAACERVTGYPAKELLGKPFWTLIPGQERPAVEGVFDQLRGDGEPSLHENDWSTRQGGRRRIAWSNTVIRDAAGQVMFVIGTGIDVTELRRSEAARLGSESRLSGIIESAMDAILSVDESQHIVLFNPAAEEMFGRQSRDVIGQPLEQLLPERFRRDHQRHVQHFGSTGISSRRMGRLGRVWGLRANGEEFPVEASISQTRADGRSLQTVILRDVTERERAARTTELLASIVESSDDAIFGTDLDGRILSWNPAAEHIFGHSPEEIIGQALDLLTPADRRRELEAHRKQIAGGQSVDHFETVRLRKDGRRIELSLSLSPLRDRSGKVVGAAVTARDVTERRRMERQLRHAEELAALGTLVAGLAHDIGTPLNVVLGYADLLGRSVEKPGDRERVETIREQIQRVARLIQSLLKVARPEAVERAPVDLDALLAEALNFLREKLRRRQVRLEQDLGQVGEVRGDRERLERTFLNLFLNAVDAMPRGGTLRLETRSLAGDAVEVRIADTGVGISEEAVDRIFEPFYTSKAPGQGSGLGLLVARGTVLDHGGTLEVKSELGKGTEFRLVLPRKGKAPGATS